VPLAHATTSSLEALKASIALPARLYARKEVRQGFRS
jgi:hypothetical protein